MAKDKGSSSKTLHDTTSTKHTADSKTTLSEDNFSSLRDKIHAKLKNQNPSKSEAKKTKVTKPTGNSTQNGDSRGKKRKSDGTVLKGVPHTESGKAAHRADDKIDEAELRDIVKELGGTDEDLALIADVDSDSEIEGLAFEPKAESSSKDGKTLEQGISNILKEIELAQGKHREEPSEVEEEDSIEEDGGDLAAPSVSRTKVEERVLAQRQDLDPGEPRKKAAKSRFKCEPRPDWYVTSEIDLSKESMRKPSQQSIDSLQGFARSLLDAENETFKATQQTSSSQSFYNTVIASGTLSDRISALTLAVQESPLHNVKPLDTLIGLAGKRSRAQAIEVLRALKDLFAQGSLLPSERRLLSFSSHPIVCLALADGRSDNVPDAMTVL